MRLGLYPADARREGSIVARGLRRRAESRSGTGTATRSTTPTATSSRRPAWCSPAPRRTASWSSSSSCPRDVHPYYVATQAHPELRSRPTRPHPLFAGLVGAAIERQRELRFPIDESRPAPRARSTTVDGGPLDEPGCTDVPETWPVAESRVDLHRRRLGRRAARRLDPPARTARRAVPRWCVEHPGAVVVARGRRATTGCCCLRQYRHPAGERLRASCRPACCDVAGEDPLEVAPARAARGGRPRRPTDWTHLVSRVLARRASPPRRIHFFLARGLSRGRPRRLRAASTRRPTWRPAGCRSPSCSSVPPVARRAGVRGRADAACARPVLTAPGDAALATRRAASRRTSRLSRSERT